MIERALIKLDHGYLHYRHAGSGPALVLIHATPRSSHTYIRVLPLLAERFTTYALDTPGYGASDPLPVKPSIHDYAQVVAQFIKQVAGGRASVLGQSTGACIACQVAVASPPLVERLLLVNPPVYPTPEIRQERVARARAVYKLNEDGFPLPRTTAEVIADTPHRVRETTPQWVEMENMTAGVAGKAFLYGLDAVSQYDILASISKVKAPVLILYGAQYYMAQYQKHLAERAQRCTLAYIEGGNFFPQWDAPEAFAKAVAQFLPTLHQPH